MTDDELLRRIVVTPGVMGGKPCVRGTRLTVRYLVGLLAHGATNNDIQVRELSRPNQVRIQLGVSMEEKGHPFYQKPEVDTEGKYALPYQSNPRLVWVVNALESNGLQIQKSQLDHLDTNWTVMSGQFSDTMRNNAIIALSKQALAVEHAIALVAAHFDANGMPFGSINRSLVPSVVPAVFPI